jgi:Mor family transcriptional regulator
MVNKRKIDTSKRGKFTEILQQVIDDGSNEIVKELKLASEIALKASEIVIGKLQEIAGGEGFYVGKAHLWTVTEKHRRIYRRFTGANHRELAHEFGLSVRRIYSIIERVGEEEFDRKQCKLFDEG